MCISFAMVSPTCHPSVALVHVEKNVLCLCPNRSMLPDVVDQAALERGVRREELFYAFFVFGNKFAGGVTLGISAGVYKYVS